LKQKQVYGIVTGEEKRPADPPEDATTVETLPHCTAINDWVHHHGTRRSMILLGIKPMLHVSYMDIIDAQTLRNRISMVSNAKMMFIGFPIREELFGIALQNCDNVDV